LPLVGASSAFGPGVLAIPLQELLLGPPHLVALAVDASASSCIHLHTVAAAALERAFNVEYRRIHALSVDDASRHHRVVRWHGRRVV
jgi:hypothetical protein